MLYPVPSILFAGAVWKWTLFTAVINNARGITALCSFIIITKLSCFRACPLLWPSWLCGSLLLSFPVDWWLLQVGETGWNQFIMFGPCCAPNYPKILDTSGVSKTHSLLKNYWTFLCEIGTAKFTRIFVDLTLHLFGTRTYRYSLSLLY